MNVVCVEDPFVKSNHILNVGMYIKVGTYCTCMYYSIIVSVVRIVLISNYIILFSWVNVKTTYQCLSHVDM